MGGGQDNGSRVPCAGSTALALIVCVTWNNNLTYQGLSFPHRKREVTLGLLQGLSKRTQR